VKDRAIAVLLCNESLCLAKYVLLLVGGVSSCLGIVNICCDGVAEMSTGMSEVMSAQAHMTSTRAKIAAVESASSALQAELEGTATALAAAKTAPARAELLERIEAAENNCARLRRMTMALHSALKRNSQLTVDAHEDVEHTLSLLKSKVRPPLKVMPAWFGFLFSGCCLVGYFY
jgi:hypothetical protein